MLTLEFKPRGGEELIKDGVATKKIANNSMKRKASTMCMAWCMCLGGEKAVVLEVPSRYLLCSHSK